MAKNILWALALTILLLAGGCDNQNPRAAEDLNGVWVQNMQGEAAEGEQTIHISGDDGRIVIVFYDYLDEPAMEFNLKVVERKPDKVVIDAQLVRTDCVDCSDWYRLEYKFQSDDVVECISQGEVMVLNRKK